MPGSKAFLERDSEELSVTEVRKQLRFPVLHPQLL
jgi:hypothetical protein